MRIIVEFLKTTFVGGLFVLLPVLLFYLLFVEMMGLIVALATPIADFFPKGTFDRTESPLLLAVILLVGGSFLIGLIMRTKAGSELGRWIEGNTIGRLPAYKAVKSLTEGFAGQKERFRSALSLSDDGSWDIVYVIEDLGDGRLTVMLPQAPMAFAGRLKIVDRDRVELLDANLGDFSRAVSHWGVGLSDLLAQDRAPAATKPAKP